MIIVSLTQDSQYENLRAEKRQVFDHSDYEWKRVSELVDTPQFISNGTTRFDVNQGGIQSYTHQVQPIFNIQISTIFRPQLVNAVD